MPTKQVLIGDHALHGEDRAGQWIVEELEGWYEPPNPKGATADRINGHGEIDVLDYYAARTPTVSGILLHNGRGQAVTAMEQLSAHIGLDLKKLSVIDSGLSRWAYAKFSGLDWTEVTRNAVRFQARFKCVDPFKYGGSNSFSVALGSAVSVFHRGTVPAWPVVTVTGSAPGGYAVSLNGRVVRVVAPLVSGSPHTLDMRTGILRVAGTRVHSAISLAEYWSVNPGLSQIANTAPVTTGSGTVKFDFYDTYI